MLRSLFGIFFDVIAPVFGLVMIGYLARRPLQLDARTLSRTAYYLLVPAFVIQVLQNANVPLRQLLQMLGFILAVQIGCLALGLVAARARRLPASMAGAYVLIAVFGNVGNFGFPIIEFSLGPDALVPATVFFLVVLVSGFTLGVAAANWHRGGSIGAALAVVKTPALIAVVPALLLNWSSAEPPLLLSRVISLLAGAMVPVMLITLGVQLASAERIRFDGDVVLSSAVRLLGGALLAVAMAALFRLSGDIRDAGILQSAMPAAVLTAIIASEHDLHPEFVTTSVLFSTVASVLTLTLLLWALL